MDTKTLEPLAQAFHLTWDSFPGAARLIDKHNLTLAVNRFAAEHGFQEGQICAKMGAPEDHRGCRKVAALKSGVAQIDRPSDGKIRGWLPIDGYPDIVVHFSVAIPKVNEN